MALCMQPYFPHARSISGGSAALTCSGAVEAPSFALPVVSFSFKFRRITALLFRRCLTLAAAGTTHANIVREGSGTALRSPPWGYNNNVATASLASLGFPFAVPAGDAFYSRLQTFQSSGLLRQTLPALTTAEHRLAAQRKLHFDHVGASVGCSSSSGRVSFRLLTTGGGTQFSIPHVGLGYAVYSQHRCNVPEASGLNVDFNFGVPTTDDFCFAKDIAVRYYSSPEVTFDTNVLDLSVPSKLFGCAWPHALGSPQSLTVPSSKTVVQYHSLANIYGTVAGGSVVVIAELTLSSGTTRIEIGFASGSYTQTPTSFFSLAATDASKRKQRLLWPVPGSARWLRFTLAGTGTVGGLSLRFLREAPAPPTASATMSETTAATASAAGTATPEHPTRTWTVTPSVSRAESTTTTVRVTRTSTSAWTPSGTVTPSGRLPMSRTRSTSSSQSEIRTASPAPSVSVTAVMSRSKERSVSESGSATHSESAPRGTVSVTRTLATQPMTVSVIGATATSTAVTASATIERPVAVPRPALEAVAAEAGRVGVATAGTVAAVVGVAGGGALTLQRVAALASFCEEFIPDESPGVLEHPLRFSVGEGRARWPLGAMVGAFLIYGFVLCAVSVASVVMLLWRRRGRQSEVLPDAARQFNGGTEMLQDPLLGAASDPLAGDPLAGLDLDDDVIDFAIDAESDFPGADVARHQEAQEEPPRPPSQFWSSPVVTFVRNVMHESHKVRAVPIMAAAFTVVGPMALGPAVAAVVQGDSPSDRAIGALGALCVLLAPAMVAIVAMRLCQNAIVFKPRELLEGSATVGAGETDIEVPPRRPGGSVSFHLGAPTTADVGPDPTGPLSDQRGAVTPAEPRHLGRWLWSWCWAHSAEWEDADPPELSLAAAIPRSGTAWSRVAHLGALFSSYRSPFVWFLLLETYSALAVSAVGAFSSAGVPWACVAAEIAAVAGAALLIAAVAVLRPFILRADTAIAVVAAVLEIIAAGLRVAGVQSSAVTAVLLCLACVALMQLVTLFIRRLISAVRKRSKKRQPPQRPVDAAVDMTLRPPEPEAHIDIAAPGDAAQPEPCDACRDSPVDLSFLDHVMPPADPSSPPDHQAALPSVHFSLDAEEEVDRHGVSIVRPSAAVRVQTAQLTELENLLQCT